MPPARCLQALLQLTHASHPVYTLRSQSSMRQRAPPENRRSRPTSLATGSRPLIREDA